MMLSTNANMTCCIVPLFIQFLCIYFCVGFLPWMRCSALSLAYSLRPSIRCKPCTVVAPRTASFWLRAICKRRRMAALTEFCSAYKVPRRCGICRVSRLSFSVERRWCDAPAHCRLMCKRRWQILQATSVRGRRNLRLRS